MPLKEDRSRLLKFDYIDSARGWAIIMVITVHLTQYYYYYIHHTIYDLLQYGKYGVQLFFCISGFTIFYSLINRKNSENRIISNFFVRRFFRIVPLYYFGIILYLIYRQGFDGNQLPITFKNLTLNLFLLNSYDPYSVRVGNLVPGGWSISVEMTFYLLLPFIVLIIRKLDTSVLFYGISIIISACWLHLLDHNGNIHDEMIELSIINNLSFFAAGIFLYYLIIQKSDFRFYHLLIILSAIAVSYLINSEVLNRIILSILYPTLIFYLSKKKNIILDNKIIRRIGITSYSIYILHFIVIDLWTKFGWAYVIDPLNNYLNLFYVFLNLIIVIFLTYFLSLFSYSFIELPAQNIAKIIVNRGEIPPLKSFL